MVGVPVCQLAEWLTTSSVSVVSLKTLYRWKRRFQDLWGNWWINQRKKWVSEYIEDEGLLSVYRNGISSNSEIQLLLSFFFAENGSVPCKGRLFSKINLRQPLSEW
ncbi:hypothetical protein [Terrilactibacillus laevilacticus]|uniref:Helix-turn-helix domain-containing protein n=1 Tax=Terrilactibacillus laevilacticus TaxID=1380157 RepID=A0ABW5PKR6_9BACI|nr:hypothetical protein [Terrilactibacillus laevilacticus]